MLHLQHPHALHPCEQLLRTKLLPHAGNLQFQRSAGCSHARRGVTATTRPRSSSITREGAGTPEPDDRIPDVALPSEPLTAPGPPTIEPQEGKLSAWQKVKRFFSGDQLDRKRLAALGLGALASYGFVSNVTYAGGMAVAWIAFVKQRGLSPLMPGQWKAFLAYYAGFWTVQNFIRPARFALAVAMAPAFDSFMNFVQNRFGCKRQTAFAVYIALLGAVTMTLTFGSIYAIAGPLAYRRTPLIV